MHEAEPRFLIFETSGRIGQVAIALGEKILGRRSLDETRRHARDLALAVSELLETAGWQPREVNAVLLSSGPGSYTGLRVGIMSAKTFAYATGCGLLAIPTFSAIALQAPHESFEVEVIDDAQQDRVYHQRFERPSGGTAWSRCSALAIKPVSTWLEELTPATLIAGPAAHIYANRLPVGAKIADSAIRTATVEGLLRLGLTRYLAGERDDLWAVEPLYLRPSAAEEKRNSLSPSEPARRGF